MLILNLRQIQLMKMLKMVTYYKRLEMLNTL
ncbi:unnamed protein product [Trichobilharzia regenti]|nr:unnamed protein product [Trichobilharzia regenti]